MRLSALSSLQPWARLPALIIPATCIAVGLFLMMARMIANDAVASPPPVEPIRGLGEAPYPDDVRTKPRTKYEEPEIPPPPARPGSTEDKTVRTQPPAPVPPADFSGPGHWQTGVPGNGPAAIRRLPDRTPFPGYPGRAQQQGIEGYVVIELRIDSRGQVLEAKVVESKPARVFDRAALAAVARWSLPSQAPEQGQRVLQRRLDFVLQE